MKYLLSVIVWFFTLTVNSQGYSIKKFNWNDAGFKGNKPVYNQTVNILNYGGNNNNTGSNNLALSNAISALNGKGGVVYFPKGVYSFSNTISINRDSITFKGAGYDSTHLRFNMNGISNNCINIYGTQINSDTTSFSIPGVRDSSWVQALNTATFQPNQWVYLQTDDINYMTSTWAYNSLGQILQIKSISGTKIEFNSTFRFYYTIALKPKIKKIIPRIAIGFECMKIQRLDATTQQTSLLSFDRAVQCWIHGVEGDSTNYAHIELNRSSNIDITNSYFHHAFSYGGGGKAYGIAFQYSSGECKIENNIFQNLRHSMLFQAGANGNVCGYNYSFNPYWSELFLPANSAGDIVFHGNYPFANLCEGNINQNTVIDNSHGSNGPYNTFFRNRSELWGIFMNNAPAGDTIQFLGNEITNITPPYGLYTITGNGHLQYANKIQGVLTPTNSLQLNENSLYHLDSQRPLCFANGIHNWPIIGIPNTYNTGSNSARDRALLYNWATCNCSNISTKINEIDTKKTLAYLFPNPIQNEINIQSTSIINEVLIYSIDGKLIIKKSEKNLTKIEVKSLEKGIYILMLMHPEGNEKYRFIKE